MFNKITQTELNRRGATSLPTKPTIAPEALKREFDAPAKEIVAPAFNNLIDALESEDAATDIGAIVPEGLPEGTPNNLQSVLESINMISQDNKELAHKHDNKDILDTITEDVVMDADYVHTDNNYTDADKSKIANMVSDENYVHTDNNYTDSDKSDVASNTNARHTHENKPTLDKFSEVDGKPQFDGQPIGGEVVVSETATLPSTIESANGNIKAISMLGNAHKSANVFDEILELGSLDGSGNNASSTTQTRSKNYIKVNPNTEYTFSREGSGQLWIIGYKADKTIIADGTAFPAYTRIVDGLGNTEATKTFHTTSTTEYLRFYNNASTDLTVKIQINLGNTALPYEPYGIIMPSGLVESESDITDKSNRIDGKMYSDSGITDSYNWCIIRVPLKKAKTISIRGMDLSEIHTEAQGAKIIFEDSDHNRISVIGRISNYEDVVVPNNAEYVGLSLVKEKGVSWYGDLDTFTVWKSSSINAKSIIPSFDLASVGDVRNELIVNADGSGKLIERVGIVDLGSFTWTYNANWNGHPAFYISNFGYKAKADGEVSDGMCSKYDIVARNYLYNNNVNAMCLQTSYLTVRDSAYSDATSFKNAMVGQKLVYIKATPTITDLTPSEVAQFLSLQTYAPSCTVSADCECTISYHGGEVGQSIADVDAKVDSLMDGIGDFVVESLCDKDGLVSGALSVTSPTTVNADATRLTTKDLIQIKPNTLYKIKSNVRFFVVCWTSSTSTSATYNSGWQTSDEFVFDSANCTCCRVGFGFADNRNITPNDIEYFGLKPYAKSNVELTSELAIQNFKSSINALSGTIKRGQAFKLLNIVTVNLVLDGVTANADTALTILNLPSSARPSELVDFIATKYGETVVGRGYIETNGNVSVRFPSALSGASIMFNVTYAL